MAMTTSCGSSLPVGAALRSLIDAGDDRLPMPGSGRTLERWRALARVAARDLSLVKLFEGHTDALAILAELGADALHEPGCSWAVWAAETPGARVRIERLGPAREGPIRVHGRKAWCSGAAQVRHALLTAWDDDEADTGDGPQLVAIDLAEPGVSCDPSPWQAVGMAASGSADLLLDAVPARRVGGPGDYLRRPGFWHGGAGIAACWYGAAAALARSAARSVARSAFAASGASPGDAPRSASAPGDALRCASLGRLDVALSTTRALLRDGAAWIDAHPRADARAIAIRCRLAAEHCAQQVLHEAGRLGGAAAHCRDRWFATMAADLPVFIRQSHGDRDLAWLGGTLGDEPGWGL
ncbi:MAG: acyl-CoA dehydrogenase [Burkholderiaceae bacterium]